METQEANNIGRALTRGFADGFTNPRSLADISHDEVSAIVDRFFGAIDPDFDYYGENET